MNALQRMVIFFIFALFIALPSFCAGASDPRQGRCAHFNGDTSRELVCRIDIVEIPSLPSVSEDIAYAVFGVLGSIDGHLFLFPDKARMLGRELSSAIFIPITLSDAAINHNQPWLQEGGAAIVTGRLHQAASNPAPPITSFSEVLIIRVAKSSHIPSDLLFPE